MLAVAWCATYARAEDVPAYDTNASASGAFYDALTPYGDWVQTASCGWVWYPYDVPIGWRPYTGGRWIDTDYGWTFDADAPWGWAVYHYGRWLYDDVYGWVWCPGTEWAPAWVVWRTGGDWIGWAPCPPSLRWREGVGFDLEGIDLDNVIPSFGFSFCHRRFFLDNDLDSFLLFPSENIFIFGETSIFINLEEDEEHHIHNRFHDEDGFERGLERDTGHRIEHFKLGDIDSPGRPRIEGRDFRVFRPDVRKAIETRTHFKPSIETPSGSRIADLRARHQSEMQTLESQHEAQRGMLDERQRTETQHVPQGVQPGDLQSRHEMENRAFEEQAARERQQLQNSHERETTRSVVPQRRYYVPQNMPGMRMPDGSRMEMPRGGMETPRGGMESPRGGGETGGGGRGGGGGRSGGESGGGGGGESGGRGR
jgi:PAS domain-containing protein